MKHIQHFVLIIIFFLLYSPAVKALDGREILEKSYQAIRALKQVSYQYEQDINYVSEDYKNSLKGQTVINFSESENILGFTFQFNNTQSTIVYNGAECFTVGYQDSTIDIISQPEIGHLSKYSFLNNSFVTIRNSIPKILANDSLEITLDSNQSNAGFYSVIIQMGQRYLDRLGDINPITTKRLLTYTIKIDKKSYLPVQVMQQNNIEVNDYVRTTFTYSQNDSRLPKEHTWYYSSYSHYRPASKENVKVIPINGIINDWELPDVNTGEMKKLSSFTEDYVLLEFWIKNCGYCISAVPKLNQLHDQFGSKGLKILGINSGDTRQDINSFVAKNIPKYPNFWDRDKILSKSLGVFGYPFVMLLDKDRKLLYQGAVGTKELNNILLNLQ